MIRLLDYGKRNRKLNINKIFKRTISGAQMIYEKLIENNTKDAFIYSGGAIMPLIDCFYDDNTVKKKKKK